MAVWAGYYLVALVVLAAVWAARSGWLGQSPRVPRYILSLALRMGGALFALLPLIVLPVWVMAALVQIPADLRTGAVAGTVLATGWLVAFLLREYETARNRHQTRIDVLAALRTEIVTFVTKLDQQNLGAAAKATQQKIRDGGDRRQRYQPVPSTESPPTVYHAVSADMKVVDPETLEVVLRFYAAHSDLRSFIDDFRSEAFAAMTAPRRAQAHADLTQNRRHTLHWGLAALDAIDASLAGHETKHVQRTDKNPDITGRRA